MPRTSTKPTFEALQAELTDPNYKVRKEAVRKIARYYRAQAAGPLLEALQDSRSAVRAKAVQVLGRLHDPRTLTPMLALLSDKAMNVRKLTARALGNFGDQSVVPALMTLLSDKQSAIRQAAARSLGRLRDPHALPLLLAYLAHAKEDERYHLAMALSDYDDPCVIEPLLTLLESQKYSSLQWIVADALGRMGDQATTPLLGILADQTRNPEVRACAAQVLGKRPRPEFLQPLLTTLGDSDEQLRASVAQALGNLQDPRAINPLLALLEDRNEDEDVLVNTINAIASLKAVEPLITLLDRTDMSQLSWPIINALKSIGNEQAFQFLLALLADPQRSPEFRKDVVLALDDLHRPEAVPFLVAALANDNVSLRYHAINALKNLRDERAIEPLMYLLDDNNELICEQAFRALLYMQVRLTNERLIQCLASSSQQVVISAVNLLGQREADPQVLKALLNMLNIPDHLTRSSVEYALASLKHPAIFEHLLVGLQTSDSEERVHFIQALGALGDKRAVAPLLALLKPHLVDHSYQRGQLALIDVLGRLGDSRAIEPLRTLFAQVSKDEHFQYYYVVYYALHILYARRSDESEEAC